MKLSKRSFPHPVIGNDDDVLGVAFQSILEMETDTTSAFIIVQTTCSSESIKKYIESGEAIYLVHVECSNTMYREAFAFTERNKRFEINRNFLNDDVEVNCFICAAKAIAGYKVDGLNKDYEDLAFDISKGDILAIGEGRVFNLDSHFDASRRIGSIMQIHESSEKGDFPMRIELENDKINVFLSKSDFSSYKSLKADDTLIIPITSFITFPVLVEALRNMAEESNDYTEYRWCRSLTKRITSLGLDGEQDFFVKAQRILELPLKKSLMAANKVLENANT